MLCATLNLRILYKKWLLGRVSATTGKHYNI